MPAAAAAAGINLDRKGIGLIFFPRPFSSAAVIQTFFPKWL
jgi:hypothetical protein